MIVVNFSIESSEANITALKSAIAAMEKASRAEEGCDDYTFSIELNNPNMIRITERWQSLSEALQAAAQAEGQTGTWISLGADLEALAADEQAALQNLASSLGG